MKLTESTINSINEIPKLKYLLINLVKKSDKLIQRNKLLQQQLLTTTSEINELYNIKQIYNEQNKEINYIKFQLETEQIKSEFNENSFNFLINFQNNFELKELKNKFNEYQQEINNLIENQNNKFNKIIKEKDQIIKNQNLEIKNFKEQIEELNKNIISKDIKNVLIEKDEHINKLKSMLQYSVKSDQRKQIHIEQLQNENLNLNNSINQISNLNKSIPVEQITRLEIYINELENRIKNSQPSKELELKNEMLMSLYDKSNNLYTQLKENYHQSFELITNNLIIENNFYFEQIKEKFKEKQNNSILLSTLKKSLLQFFLADNSTQLNLIPIILENVGCNKEQILYSLKSFESQNQIINKKNSILNIF